MHTTSNRLRALAATCLLALAITTTAPALADSAERSAVAQPATEGLVPLRSLAEASGATVTWDPIAWEATVVKGDVTLTFGLDSDQVLVNGTPVPVAQPTRLVNGTMLVSPEILAALEIYVTIDADTGTATIDRRASEGLTVTRALLSGAGGDLYAQFTPGLQAVTPVELLSIIPMQLSPLGALQQVAVTGREANAVHDTVQMVGLFANGAVQIDIHFTPAGQIDDFRIDLYAPAPPAPYPDYADPGLFTEQAVVIDAGGWPLPATLTLPKSDGPVPALVLVHGSGVHDRDESIGAVKPFRDLAHGLASRGIAVLRFEKREMAHPQKTRVQWVTSTLQEESILDAVAAVELLRGVEAVDPTQIFVLGHSLGGFVLPTILTQAEEGHVAGGVVMAGPTDMLEIWLWQHELAFSRGELPEAQLALMQQQVALLRDPAFDPASPPPGYLLGRPSYYHQWRAETTAVAQEQAIPLLILQGDRDSQVPTAQLTSWQELLADRDDVVYKRYPRLNHIFTEGDGDLGTISEYWIPANIPLYVIEDIVNWISPK